MMRVGIAADHGGFTLKGEVAESLRGSGHEVVDFGAFQLDSGDDYPDFIIPLARAAMAVGIDGLFMEVHPDPPAALCDGPNSQPLDGLKPLLEQLVAIDRLVKNA